MEIQIPSEQIWPKIGTTKIKHQCPGGFKEALSNNVVDRIVCMNQHLLHPVHEMPSCVIRLNIDIDSNSKCFKMS
ncbi:unnamed protein product, partial [Rotaria sordida]